MLTLITSETEIQKAHIAFMSRLIEVATPGSTKVNLGFKGGSEEHELEQSEEYKLFWLTRTSFEDAKGHKFHYFNAFGKGNVKPGEKVSTRVHLNYAASSEERKLSAVFAKDSNGSVFLLHNGNFRLAAGTFWAEYEGKTVEIEARKYAVVGEVSSPLVRDCVPYLNSPGLCPVQVSAAASFQPALLRVNNKTAFF